jgi:hypothetical protein
MKKIAFTIFLCAALLVFHSSSFAQGNLQFNAVKYYELSVTQPTSGTFLESTQSITVPAGKVWKIESASGAAFVSSTNQSTLTSAPLVLLDGRIIFQTTYGTAVLSMTPNILPLWLPAGTYTLSVKSSTSTAAPGYTFYGYVSALEFNIVP